MVMIVSADRSFRFQSYRRRPLSAVCYLLASASSARCDKPTPLVSATGGLDGTALEIVRRYRNRTFRKH
jgi:hypothetical protein